jgi:hypothetical protein
MVSVRLNVRAATDAAERVCCLRIACGLMSCVTPHPIQQRVLRLGMKDVRQKVAVILLSGESNALAVPHFAYCQGHGQPEWHFTVLHIHHLLCDTTSRGAITRRERKAYHCVRMICAVPVRN